MHSFSEPSTATKSAEFNIWNLTLQCQLNIITTEGLKVSAILQMKAHLSDPHSVLRNAIWQLGLPNTNNVIVPLVVYLYKMNHFTESVFHIPDFLLNSEMINRNEALNHMLLLKIWNASKSISLLGFCSFYLIHMSKKASAFIARKLLKILGYV